MKTIPQWTAALCLAAATALTTNLMAQQPKKPTLEQLIPGGDAYRYADNLYGVQWWGDTCIKPGTDSLIAVNPKTGKETLLTTRRQVNQTLAGPTDGSSGGPTVLQHFYNTSFPWADRPHMLIRLPKKYIVYDFEKEEPVGEVPPFYEETEHGTRKGENIDFSPASGHIAYTVKNNLYVDDTRVTDEPEGIVCGQTVHRNEFGISKGTFWSPAGDKLAFYRMNESMVTPYPLVDITTRIAVKDMIRYPMAGMLSHEVKVGIYDVATGKTLYLDAGDPKDRYFTNITWAPDGQSLYLVELNRDQNHARLCRYSATSGALMRVLIEERNPKYVEPQQPILFLPWDQTKFIYQSQQDGFNHLYLASTEPTGGSGFGSTATAGGATSFRTETDGEFLATVSVRQLTRGNWLVQDILGFNKKKRELIFTATKESPLQSNIYKIGIADKKTHPAEGCKVIRLDNGEGVHHPQLSASGTYLIDRYSTPDVPRRIELTSTQNGKTTACLLSARNPYEGLEMPDVKTGTLKAADGVTDLHYRLCLPAGFDPAKKYPAIVYVYGGPHAQMVTNGFMNSARGWDLYMASKGYVMFTLDNRGSSNRGMAFESCTFRRLGIEEGRDQVKGVEFLKSLPYVDARRIGVHGWSFGGHMTTALMLRYPDTFKVGVAGGPVIDWAYYEVMYGERYMDTPQTNPEGYKETNLNNLAGNLKGRLLIIHDDHDDTCVPQHALSFMKACVDARTYPDLFIYPGHKHNVAGRDRVHLHEKITRYFEEHL